MGWGAAAVILSVFSSVISYTEQEDARYEANKQRKEEGEREQAILNTQASEEERRGKEEAQKIREQAVRVKSAQNADLSGSGVKLFEGTASDILSETSSLSELDALSAIKESRSYADMLRSKGMNTYLTGSAPSPKTSSWLSTGLGAAKTSIWTYGQYKQAGGGDSLTYDHSRGTVSTSWGGIGSVGPVNE